MIKYEYKFISPIETKEKDGVVNNYYPIESSEWKFVAFIPTKSLLFERIIDDNQTVSLKDTKTNGTIKSIKINN